MFDFNPTPQWDADQAEVRLLELPQSVFFPHVFGQCRFRDPGQLRLLHEALETDRLVALGGNGNRGTIVCLCRVITHEFFDDGSCLALLVGLRRLRLLTPESSEEGRVRAEICEAPSPFDEPEEHALLRRGLHEAVAGMLEQDEEDDGELWEEQRRLLFSGDLPLGSISDILASLFEFDLPEKRALLCETVVENRARRLIRGLAGLRAERLYDRLLLNGAGGETRNN